MTRLETGVVQVNGDWPGVFIRGDDAFALSHAVAFALATIQKQKELDVSAMIAKGALDGLLRLLQESDMGHPDFNQNIQRLEGTILP
jgi:hypothetical protein